MIEPHLKKVDGHVIACLYCGDKFFKDNEEETIHKMVAMVKKLNPDVVICGPSYNYAGYAYMCGVLGKELASNTNIPVVAAMSKENEDTIFKYKDLINIVKMPKKGGIGLNESIGNICKLARKMFDKEDISELKEKICY